MKSWLGQQMMTVIGDNYKCVILLSCRVALGSSCSIMSLSPLSAPTVFCDAVRRPLTERRLTYTSTWINLRSNRESVITKSPSRFAAQRVGSMDTFTHEPLRACSQSVSDKNRRRAPLRWQLKWVSVMDGRLRPASLVVWPIIEQTLRLWLWYQRYQRAANPNRHIGSLWLLDVQCYSRVIYRNSDLFPSSPTCHWTVLYLHHSRQFNPSSTDRCITASVKRPIAPVCMFTLQQHKSLYSF